MSGPQTINLVEINIPGHLLKCEVENYLSSPRTMNVVKIIILAMSRNIFNGIYFVSKSLEHDLEYKLLFFGLSFGLFYRS